MPATRSPSARTQERHGSTEPRKCAHQGLKKFKIAMRVEPLSPTLRCPAPLRNEGVEDGAEEEEEEEEGGEGGGGGGVTHAERERAAQGGIRAAARRANPPPQEGTLSRSHSPPKIRQHGAKHLPARIRRQERTREVPSGIVRCAPGSEPMR
ncbi:unnamed protein product [Prorocentrum cordatum]|uniref:Uncharacterized protein n=1 Tax=Prorocentrum cordatum TaxID=2364126 RepID=A0ABN9X4U6_9DINO|nr:unnamed protein product [Polarella glacialis]